MWKENKLVKEKKSEGGERRRKRNSGRNDEKCKLSTWEFVFLRPKSMLISEEKVDLLEKISLW